MYKRVLVKLSGEALYDDKKRQILQADNLKKVAEEIKLIVDKGVEVAVVIGAGNIFRGKMAEQIGIDRANADYMGMLGTIVNSIALHSALTNIGVDTRVMSSLEINAIAEPYIRKELFVTLRKERVVILGGGTGNPYFTTDTTATLRAMEIGADAIFMAKNNVDGVYDSDPTIIKSAKMFKTITYREIIEKDLKVMDQTAISLIADKNITIRVFNMSDPTNFERVLNGEDVGTTIRRD